MSYQVNRYLHDQHFDHIDHALGRPLDPTAIGKTHRNYFAVGTDNPLAKAFRASPHWKEGRALGDMAYFHVTKAGRDALAQHLRAIGDPHKAFAVTWNGFTATVIATSRSKAAYSAYLSASDGDDSLTFGKFQKNMTVRAAQ